MIKIQSHFPANMMLSNKLSKDFMITLIKSGKNLAIHGRGACQEEKFLSLGVFPLRA
jgi:hypothetical protein